MNVYTCASTYQWRPVGEETDVATNDSLGLDLWRQGYYFDLPTIPSQIFAYT